MNTKLILCLLVTGSIMAQTPFSNAKNEYMRVTSALNRGLSTARMLISLKDASKLSHEIDETISDITEAHNKQQDFTAWVNSSPARIVPPSNLLPSVAATINQLPTVQDLSQIFAQAVTQLQQLNSSLATRNANTITQATIDQLTITSNNLAQKSAAFLAYVPDNQKILTALSAAVTKGKTTAQTASEKAQKLFTNKRRA